MDEGSFEVRYYSSRGGTLASLSPSFLPFCYRTCWVSAAAVSHVISLMGRARKGFSCILRHYFANNSGIHTDGTGEGIYLHPTYTLQIRIPLSLLTYNITYLQHNVGGAA